MVLNYYHDPGHGWIKVQRKQLLQFGIHKDISRYSYESYDGMTVFLEEDCDASLFIDKLKERNIPYTFKDFHSNKYSRIRNYNEYTQY